MIQDIVPKTYEELKALDLEYSKLSAAMGRLWMSSKRRGALLRDIRRSSNDTIETKAPECSTTAPETPS